MNAENNKLSDPWPKLSVVIPIFNEERFIEQTIKLVQNQDYPEDKLEILVIDGESTDGSVKIVNKMAQNDNRIKVHQNSKRLSSAARNIGARKATGEIVLYIDGHVYIDNSLLLKNVARLMKEKDVSVLSRPGFQDTPNNLYIQSAIALARKSFFGHGLGSTGFSNESKYVSPESTGTYYHRDIIEKAGYFDEDFDAAEDFEFNYRLHKMGYRSYTAPELIIYYYPRDSLGGLFCQMKRYGVGRTRLMFKHPEAFSLIPFIPAALLMGVPLILLLSLVLPMMKYAAIGIYGSYLGIDLLVTSYIGFKNGFKYIALLPAIFPVIHIGLGWGIITEMLNQLLSRFFGNKPNE
jgi:glycosyltransferase involved in cell wall biosynthesis